MATNILLEVSTHTTLCLSEGLSLRGIQKFISQHLYQSIAEDTAITNSGRKIQFSIANVVMFFPYQGLQEDFYYLTCNGKLLDSNRDFAVEKGNTIIKINLCLFGGKGGFGTLIRAMGTQINKNASKGACRDLSGRRVRDVKAEKRVVKAIAEKSSKKIKSDSVIHKEITESDSASDTYVKLVKDSEETVDSALQQGLKEGKTRKRKKEDTSKEGGTKKTKLWLGIDDDFYDSDSDGSDSGGHSSQD